MKIENSKIMISKHRFKFLHCYTKIVRIVNNRDNYEQLYYEQLS